MTGIKADNYRYTKNITKEHIDLFEKDLKTKRNSLESGSFIVLRIDSQNNAWGDVKRRIAQIYDFLEDHTSKIKIIFNGNNDFELWLYPSKGKAKKYIDDTLKEKFKSSKYHKFRLYPKSKKLNLYSIDKDTGLSSLDIKRSQLTKFRKKDSVLDKIYKELTQKTFKWNKKGKKLDADEKLILSKKVKEYFKFMQDQLKEMYGGGVKSPTKLKDRDRKNFFQQVRNLWKKKKTADMRDVALDSNDSHLGNPPYQGDLHQYIRERQEDDGITKKNKTKLKKLSRIISGYLDDK